MKRFSYILCLVQLVVICNATLPRFPERLEELPQFKGKYTGKIVGGELVEKCNEYPHQVSVQRKSLMTGGNSHFCGGSIINEKTILTAAHCANGRSAPSISIVAGTHKLDSAGKEGKRYQAHEIVVHEKYSSRDVDYDMALIFLNTSMDMSSSNCMKPAQLPHQDEEIKEGTICDATGWGTTSEGGSTSSTLRTVSVPVVGHQECRASYGQSDITDRMICAGLKEGGKDSCQGDSGGPMVCRNSKGDFILGGVVSWGYGCARPEYYGVYTRVAHFSDWISAKIRQFNAKF